MSMQTGPKINRDGLILALDAADLGSYPGAGTVWNDLSGGGNHGVLVNGVAFDNGNFGAIRFDGVDDYVTMSNVINLGNVFTISSFVKITGSTADSVVVGTDANGSDNWFGIFSNKLFLYFTETSDVNNSATYGLTTLSYGVFHQIAATIDGSTASIYLNGKLEATSTAAFTIGAWSGAFAIGKRSPNVSQRFLTGDVANVLFYNRKLSAAEIKQNFDAQKPRFKLN